jgi:hypothetical protein
MYSFRWHVPSIYFDGDVGHVGPGRACSGLATRPKSHCSRTALPFLVPSKDPPGLEMVQLCPSCAEKLVWRLSKTLLNLFKYDTQNIWQIILTVIRKGRTFVFSQAWNLRLANFQTPDLQRGMDDSMTIPNLPCNGPWHIWRKMNPFHLNKNHGFFESRGFTLFGTP